MFKVAKIKKQLHDIYGVRKKISPDIRDQMQ